MKKQQKTPASGAQYAGTPPVQHSEVVLAQQEEEESKKAAAEKTRLLNEDDIEADRHNGSGGAFEATEKEWDEE